MQLSHTHKKILLTCMGMQSVQLSYMWGQKYPYLQSKCRVKLKWMYWKKQLSFLLFIATIAVSSLRLSENMELGSSECWNAFKIKGEKKLQIYLCWCLRRSYILYLTVLSTGGLRQSSEKNQLYASCDKGGTMCERATWPRAASSPLAFLESLCTQALHLQPVKLYHCLLTPFHTDLMAAHLKVSGLKTSS